MGDRIVVMKDGFIQQVDTPMKLYNEPANLFVARFIGSPSMNFLTVRLSGEPGALRLAAPGLDLPVSPAHAARLAAYAGRDVIVGIRPDAIHDTGEFLAAHRDWTLDVRIDVVEPMGSESFIYFSVNAENIVARVPPATSARVMSPHRLAFDMDAAHYFDPETQRTIDGAP